MMTCVTLNKYIKLKNLTYRERELREGWLPTPWAVLPPPNLVRGGSQPPHSLRVAFGPRGGAGLSP
jgi:hypothetical protein